MNPHDAPDIDADGSNYAHCSVSILIDIKPAEFFEWYTAQRLEDFLLGTLVVPPITHTEMLEGPDWGAKDSARKIFFKDGTVALERITATDYPNSYEYQPWAYTSPVRFLSDYAKARTRALEENGQTRIVWDYAFHCKGSWALPLLKLFVQLDWKRNMTRAMDVIQSHLADHGTALHLNDAKVLKDAA